MMFIMGMASVIACICALFPGGEDCWLATQMSHVAWNGLRHHDTIFPLFLFIAGISFPYSYANQVAKGKGKGKICLRIIRRGLVLVFLGMVYNGFFKFDFAHLRVASVLGRIGLAWAFAALLFVFCKKSVRAVIAAVILVGYWLLIAFVPAPDTLGADPLSMQGNLVGWVDRQIMPGILLYDGGRFDPEGLLSTLPAIVTALLGMFTGEFVRLPEEKVSGNGKTLWMFCAAAVMAVVGLLWSKVFPINKMLWSSTFVLVVGAFSLASFALFYYLIDVRGWRKWTLPFRVIGMNSITIYLGQGIIDFWAVSAFFFGGIASKCPGNVADLILNIGYVAACWLFLFFLYKKKVFLKV